MAGKACGKMMPGGKTKAKPSAGKVKGAFKKGGAVKKPAFASGGGVGRQNKSGW